MNKPILILDAGGVIIEDLTTKFWDILVSLSADSHLTRESLYKQYKKDYSEKLWSGQINEEQFLAWLSCSDINLTLTDLRIIIASCLVPLPAFEKVKTWAERADIYIMSNHLTAWLTPALEPIKPFLIDIYVSDNYKLKKPSIGWFELIATKHSNRTIMFVDNTLHNVEAAAQVGWNTVYAQPDQSWINQVDHWLMEVTK